MLQRQAAVLDGSYFVARAHQRFLEQPPRHHFANLLIFKDGKAPEWANLGDRGTRQVHGASHHQTLGFLVYYSNGEGEIDWRYSPRSDATAQTYPV